MKINRLELNNFRNYERFEIEPSDGINLILGRNAIGKTNLLEAIYLLTVGKSFRALKTNEMIKIGEEFSNIKATVESNGYIDELEIILNANQKNKYILNSDSVNVKNYAGDFSCVIFSPNDLNMIKLSPGERRKYIDNLIEKVSPIYKYNLAKYKKIIFERNKLLKRPNEDLLRVYDFQLATYGVKILFERLKFIKEIEEFAKQHYYRLSQDSELKITYLSTIKFTKEKMEEVFMNILLEQREKDFESRFTTLGPHRDDLDFKINSMSAKSFASQGETRSIVLALKLAEMDVLEKNNKNRPILLLDDVFSELDKTRAKYLAKSLDNMQTFITSTNLNEENFLIDSNKINVERL
ncbi:DNA replication and repair protein RecF [Peptoniphilus asaccharolyticus DSM 20463]|uniref:DNA replication and repair protein RecF n=1 Tax=Peptoniphilus asaccharolyticus DSM 20463 TaxID=573058 RepID=A0A1W1V4J8_PEPAS|nr:DNA replication/repair protein RecF [Peptoniphilus asaccharolyticus]MBL7576246.1 DNA replication/repair protein RecF [Peptoniphilus asaccharolyticus]SMB87941.1 DNA replication and repair protein RecF [Peptoniphilus asaccharolyticus DSM 20463]